MKVTDGPAGGTSAAKQFHIAPMIDVSTIEFRTFIRLLTKRAVVWNMMVVAETLVHKSAESQKERASCEGSDSEQDGDWMQLSDSHLLRYAGWYDDRAHGGGASPHPTVCQIGSNSPSEAAFAVRVAQKCGYDAVDLNCECPSDRVAGRCFGAALMKDQAAAVEVVSSMAKSANSIDGPFPVSVKTRIGVDDEGGYEFMVGYLQKLIDAGCSNFVLHARKVFTQGLSPAQNRDVPPLDYPLVYRLMDRFPQCTFVINGGINSLEHARDVAFGSTARFDECGNVEYANDCRECDGENDHAVPCERCNLPQGSCLHPRPIAPSNLCGVMVGRLARDRPAELADVDRFFYGEAANPCQNRRELMERYIAFLERVYPRRCCDANEVSMGMASEMAVPIVPKRQCCSVCREFRGQDGDADNEMIPDEDRAMPQTQVTASNSNRKRTQGGKRAKRHARYKGAKIVTRIMDQSLQPTWGILAGERGKNAFRNAQHKLSRDNAVRNCGPGYVLWKAMQVVPDDVWDKPFELSGAKTTTYYPSK
ncbi:hypothetical protein ACHAXT_001074 [Thalassiosira profunda]